MSKMLSQALTTLSRRRFVQGLAAGGVIATLPGLIYAGSRNESSRLGTPPVLSGREIDLVVAETPVNFTGVTRMATTINGSIPAPTLRLQEGDEVTISRQFAPYVGVECSDAYGDTADYRQTGGQDSSDTQFVTGLRFWF